MSIPLDPAEFQDILKSICIAAALKKSLLTDEQFDTLRMLAYAEWHIEVLKAFKGFPSKAELRFTADIKLSLEAPPQSGPGTKVDTSAE